MALERVRAKAVQYKNNVSERLHAVKHRGQENAYEAKHASKQAANPLNPGLKAKHGIKEKLFFWKNKTKEGTKMIGHKSQQGALGASGQVQRAPVELKAQKHKLAYWTTKAKSKLFPGRV